MKNNQEQRSNLLTRMGKGVLNILHLRTPSRSLINDTEVMENIINTLNPLFEHIDGENQKITSALNEQLRLLNVINDEKVNIQHFQNLQGIFERLYQDQERKVGLIQANLQDIKERTILLPELAAKNAEIQETLKIQYQQHLLNIENLKKQFQALEQKMSAQATKDQINELKAEFTMMIRSHQEFDIRLSTILKAMSDIHHLANENKIEFKNLNRSLNERFAALSDSLIITRNDLDTQKATLGKISSSVEDLNRNATANKEALSQQIRDTSAGLQNAIVANTAGINELRQNATANKEALSQQIRDTSAGLQNALHENSAEIVELTQGLNASIHTLQEGVLELINQNDASLNDLNVRLDRIIAENNTNQLSAQLAAQDLLLNQLLQSIRILRQEAPIENNAQEFTYDNNHTGCFKNHDGHIQLFIARGNYERILGSAEADRMVKSRFSSNDAFFQHIQANIKQNQDNSPTSVSRRNCFFTDNHQIIFDIPAPLGRRA